MPHFNKKTSMKKDTLSSIARLGGKIDINFNCQSEKHIGSRRVESY